MICPDIWTLPPPSTLITHKRERLDDKALHQLRQTIDAHYFNSLVSNDDTKHMEMSTCKTQKNDVIYYTRRLREIYAFGKGESCLRGSRDAAMRATTQ